MNGNPYSGSSSTDGLNIERASTVAPIIINIINAFQSFSQVKLLTNESPNSSTNLIVYAIWHDAFRANRFETAAARSVILFLMILVITLIQFSFEKRSVNY